ncbi:DUF551 domain-containing protein [Budvicia aquatica]|uniref:DUF551 domain-containing protein n=1 Tax=Budvicia aquatica TaxID=82979 RepID=A0A2C6DRW8_9GAMM|nr:DUF551 domain-containing protein [Budvicia aquatica]PHI31072.1 DUF551 domain-containing protein [Budvicia aquatica]PHI31202.1 DUF551 domain-containing protein [Budvicia aquatica]VFS51303.1 Protein of uncharacterised function (DUF551) [Budvicia aquatica]VFS51465.1 Protein of uncharacterised function (DUF551) [Budvicia aquatica]
MTNKLSKERLEKIAFGSVRQSQEEGVFIAREVLEYREAEGNPVYWEIAGCLFSTKEEALKPGFIGTPEPLYESPALGQPVATGWISVADHLPELDTDVQIYCLDSGEQMVAYRFSDTGFSYATTEGGSVIACEPTHWMELPAAPEVINND